MQRWAKRPFYALGAKSGGWGGWLEIGLAAERQAKGLRGRPKSRPRSLGVGRKAERQAKEPRGWVKAS